ncbi:MAG: GntR family transcriptional regulator [Gemmataceae bacterium]|nr:GntR family transcriptional regulator [Gemmataceae bacterium]
MTEVRLCFSRPTLADQAYEYLLRQISTGAYPPGTPLREAELVAHLGFSRTPIRDALLRLMEYGLLEMAGRSPHVRRLSREDVIHIYQVRRVLEPEAVKRACGRLTAADFAHLEALVPPPGGEETPTYEAACYRLDIELHRLIVDRAGNPILAREIRKLHDRGQLIHKPAAFRRGWLAEEVRQHVQIIAALKTGDWRSSCKTLLDHLRSSARMQLRCALTHAERRGAQPEPLASSEGSGS